MPNVALVPALAKTLLAIAWADGDLHPEEETTVKEVVGLLPSMSAGEWALIELYLVAPIAPDEREELVAILQNTIRSAEDKRIALDAVDAMIAADGTVTPSEDAVARGVRDALAAVDVSPLGLVRRVVGGAFRPTPRREAGLEHWRANPLGYLLHVLHNAPPDPVLDVAALAAGIMAQVVRVVPDNVEAERPVLQHALQTDWGVSAEQAAQLAEIAIAVTRRNVDYHRISRELVPRSTEAQRVALLNTLFAIANAADNVAPGEIDEIRVIAERLQLTRQQFIAAKLTIPAADRGGL